MNYILTQTELDELKKPRKVNEEFLGKVGAKQHDK